jgi:protein-tyrosine phosphatase
MSEVEYDATEVEGDDVLLLASADNFRDVAGAGYPTADGGAVRTGVFYRSNALRITPEEVGLLADLGLRAVVDLRTHVEIERHPDPEIPSCEWLHYDVLGIPMGEIAALTDHDVAVQVMHRVYRGFVENPASRAAFGDMFRQLATGGPQLFHCSAGKDRTGWVAALLLHLAGVEDAVIEADYLLTNERSVESRARAEQAVARRLGADHVPVFAPTMVADVDYLHTAYAAVETSYGDRAAYLREGLDLDDATLDALRGLLVER